MKLKFKTGDILSEDVEAVINSANCVGVMGCGIAFQFKNAYPANFKAYAAACRRHQVEPGRMFVQETHQLASPRWIINFPTKRHWKSKSRLEDIQAGLFGEFGFNDRPAGYSFHRRASSWKWPWWPELERGPASD